MNAERRVALVTGAARGIGAACARALAASGADIVVNDVTHLELAESVCRDIRALGQRALLAPADVSQRSQVQDLVDAAVQTFGQLDIAVANAYRSIRQPFLEVTPEAMEATFAVTYWGAFHTCQLAARHMVQHGRGGRIIVVSSIHAEQPFARSTSYNAAKAAALHMARTAAAELAQHHITVNCIAPGWIDTPGERDFATEEQLRTAREELPWKRLGRPEEIGAIAAFLASPAAEFVSGALIRADGAQMVALGSDPPDIGLRSGLTHSH
ncbi:MAG: SDR family oxidoreductase [Chloroflexi bacterium]|nr:SDR family oxidoreductase [Chloroflexota bacterium]